MKFQFSEIRDCATIHIPVVGQVKEFSSRRDSTCNRDVASDRPTVERAPTQRHVVVASSAVRRSVVWTARVMGEDANPSEPDTGGREVTREMVMAGVAKAESKRGLNEAVDAYLARLTHLTLDGRNIGGKMDVIASVLPGVRVLYLYDNVIRRMSGLERLTKLTHLYLQNNRIERVAGLENSPSLVKLYLDGNKITLVDGLEACAALEELHVSGQKLEPPEELRFDPACLRSLSRTLQVLNASHNPLRDPRPIRELVQLRRLTLERCAVESVRDLEPVLLNCARLRSLDVRGNPFAKNPKHRDHVTLLSDSLQTLNDREIKPHERQFLIQLQTRRMQKREAARQRSQQQRQHLETIANLGEGTVDHGFDNPARDRSGSPRDGPDDLFDSPSASSPAPSSYPSPTGRGPQGGGFGVGFGGVGVGSAATSPGPRPAARGRFGSPKMPARARNLSGTFGSVGAVSGGGRGLDGEGLVGVGGTAFHPPRRAKASAATEDAASDAAAHTPDITSRFVVPDD